MNVRIPALVMMLGLALASAGLAGCTSGQGGTPTPSVTTSSEASSAASSTDPAAAPAVAHPLDASKLIAQPCTALTTADLTALQIVNATPGGTHQNAGGVQCSWTGDSGGSVSIGWETADTNGLSDLYAKSSTIAYWQPTSVSGYPAAYGDVISDGRNQGDCVINVAVSSKLFFDAQFENPLNAGQSCALAKQAALAVIKNLGG